MNLEIFMNAGVYFNYCRFAVFPQIPYVQDVLYVLQLGKKHTKGYYSPAGAANWATYVENTVLVAAAVASKILGMERYNEEMTARKIIAEAILALCPPDAKCLFNSAFVAAQEEFVGQPAPSKIMSRAELLHACGCKECTRVIRAEEFENVFGSHV